MNINVLPNRAQTDFLELALKSETGNPFPLIGMRERAGGSKSRMMERLQEQGYFDGQMQITTKGIEACLLSMARQRIDLGFRTVKRMIFYPDPVNDDTVRCITCGQIDEEGWHQEHVCRGMRIVITSKCNTCSG